MREYVDCTTNKHDPLAPKDIGQAVFFVVLLITLLNVDVISEATDEQKEQQ